jgi:hypothetical protein
MPGALAADAGQGVAAMGEQGVDRGALLVAGRGMDDEAGGLVEDDEVGVLVEDVEARSPRAREWRRRRVAGRAGSGRRAMTSSAGLVTTTPSRLTRRASIRPSSAGTREVAEGGGEETVEPLAGRPRAGDGVAALGCIGHGDG